MGANILGTLLFYQKGVLTETYFRIFIYLFYFCPKGLILLTTIRRTELKDIFHLVNLLVIFGPIH